VTGKSQDRADGLTRCDYPVWHSEKLRSYDLDAQRHVNNNVLASFCEEGRRAFLRETVVPFLASGTGVVVARYTIEFLRPVTYPGMVDVGTSVMRIGTSSLTLSHGLFCGDHCMVQSEAAIVFVDAKSGRGHPLPQAARDALALYEHNSA
jgi:acyl-CoA thioester hydrolase